MSAEGFRRTAVADRVLAGAAVGGIGGILAVPFGVPGLALLGAVALLSALVPPRFAFLAGLLTSTGLAWVFFTTQGVLRCAASPSSCSGVAPFAVVAGLVLGFGILLLALTRNRFRSVK